MDIEKLRPYMMSHDMNWFYNPTNFPNQGGIIEPIVDFVERERPGRFQTIDFLNLTEWHYRELQKQYERPVDFVKHLTSLALPPIERAMLMAALLKMYGGIPVENKHDKYYSIRRLIEREFLYMAGDELLPEKQLCSREAIEKKLLHAEALVDADIINQRPVGSIRSRYFNKVAVDFADLPLPIAKEIVELFDGKNMGGTGPDSYDTWIGRLHSFLRTVPHIQNQVLQKSIEYGTAAFRYHQQKECQKSTYCALDDSWERRIGIAEDLLQRIHTATESNLANSPVPFRLNDKAIPKIDFIRLVNVLCELRIFRNDDETIPAKKEVMAVLGELLHLDFTNFQQDLNKGLENSLEANTKIFDRLKLKAEQLWENKNSNK